MGEVNKPAVYTRYIARNSDGSVLHVGGTTPEQVTTTGQPTLETETDVGAFLERLATWADWFPLLPSEDTELTAGERYNHGGGVVEVRQHHRRTADDPDTIPALFLTVNFANEWIAGEAVEVGQRRTYGGDTWQVIQAHVTQAGWEPPNVPALWLLVSTTDEWQAGVAYAIDDQVTYNDVLYVCIQTHTSQAGWEPPNVPALWSTV